MGTDGVQIGYRLIEINADAAAVEVNAQQEPHLWVQMGCRLGTD